MGYVGPGKRVDLRTREKEEKRQIDTEMELVDNCYSMGFGSIDR